jgi:K+-sensing histidine kinase KdpD
VLLTIADRGIGIPEGQHEAIFDSFHRAHRDSPFPDTGLGLPSANASSCATAAPSPRRTVRAAVRASI